MRTAQTHCLRGHPRTPENLRSNGRSVYCLPCSKATDKDGRIRRRTADPLRFMLGELRRNAKKRGQYFALKPEDFGDLPTHCPVLGIELDYSGSGLSSAASVDRSDSTLGYVPGNVVIMSRRANTLKNNATVEELEKVLAYMLNHQAGGTLTRGGPRKGKLAILCAAAQRVRLNGPNACSRERRSVKIRPAQSLNLGSRPVNRGRREEKHDGRKASNAI
jgi:hypothetical protein